jgi:serine/threonine protein phosphatase PrpC
MALSLRLICKMSTPTRHPMAEPLHYTFCSRTDRGRVRENNEDALFVNEDRCLAVLADGMGGYNAGEVAAGMAVASVGTRLGGWLARAPHSPRAEEVGPVMAASVSEANRAIHEAARSQPACQGMGTTLVAAVFLARQLVVGHVGDSRCYRWREGQLEQITRDHSLLQAQIDAGLITPAQAARSKRRNIVTRAVGVESSVRVDIAIHTVLPGDCYVLCTDGLTDMVDDIGLAGALAEAPSLPAMARALVAQANAQGGRDNITVLVVQAAGETATQRRLLARWGGQATGQH